MRRLDKEIVDKEIVLEILDKAEICRLGLVDNGEAYIVPVNYAYHDNHIYIHSAKVGRKMDILRENKNVTFEIEGHSSIQTGVRPCDWTARYRSVMGKGEIEIELDTEKKRQALDLIMKKYGWGNAELSYDEALLSRVGILILKINQISAKQSGNWD